ncbi:MAG: DUF4105 domain-containing protein [Pirellulaceae bacterium]|nr:DUF4105 domain-containing protein [Pirellulaceae bacterium]
MRRFASITGRLLLCGAVGFVSLWCILALSFFPPVPRWLGALLALGFAAGMLALKLRLKDAGAALRYFCIAALSVLLAWLLVQPTHQRPWSKKHAIMPRAVFDGDRVTVRNIRRTIQAASGDCEVQHRDQVYELDELDSVWLGVQHFAAWKGVAHTFVSFGFTDGDYLAISIESRRREGERFSALAGLFKQFGVIYVVGDEQEIIGHRALADEGPLYLFPIHADRQQMRDMLVSMLRRANRLAEQPEFYNTLTNNCTTNILESFNQIAPIHISPYSPRIVFPGYSGDVAYDQGLIAADEPFSECKARAHINEVARAAAASEDFSQRIRAQFGRE